MTDSGVSAELSVASTEACPIAAISEEPGATVTSVARTAPFEDGGIVAEFAAETDSPRALDSIEEAVDGDTEPRYRFERARADCVCETVESVDCPVSDAHAADGRLLVTVDALDVARVTAIVARLRELSDDVVLRSLRQADDADPTDAVLVDRSRLTDRQREVLETAVEMGYFEYPKGANAGDVAAALDISVSTLAEHLAAAQTKLLDQVLAD
ncbi:helix-turn-helix domain-containing protein [Haloarcula marina]|uniref:helix-turn-helix domain-containing protein n=1 Tax=Haloarcula marina TaxID=2961574 RepID=UPI0020B85007|nr:helix-turn-helix domain-containing protein [Halomicroarcula marina]